MRNGIRGYTRHINKLIGKTLTTCGRHSEQWRTRMSKETVVDVKDWELAPM